VASKRGFWRSLGGNAGARRRGGSHLDPDAAAAIGLGDAAIVRGAQIGDQHDDHEENRPNIGKRVVRGYHGTRLGVAATILEMQANEPSRKPDNWLGSGAYYWEAGLRRAWIWAEHRYGKDAVVVSVNINLDQCLDLVDGAQHPLLQIAHELVRRDFERQNLKLPANTKTQHPLDCLVIDYVCDVLKPGFTTIRAPFEDGDPVYQGSRITSMAHVQICVKGPASYEGPFRIEEHG